MRTIFIGDVHGCLTELRMLIAALAITTTDRVILLGDLINRGPDSVGVVSYVYHAGFECLMGNHEDEYLSRGKEDKYLRLREQLGPRLHRWIEGLPLYLETADFLAVHAGLQPGCPPSRTRRKILLNIRTWDGEGRDLRNPENPPWYASYTGDRPVFYGHWARAGLTLRETTFGLDSGCVYGRQLSAWILEEDRLVQIPAQKAYYVPPELRK